MQLKKANELIDHCLSAIGNSLLDEDELLAWIETLDALDRNLDLAEHQFARIEELLRRELKPRVRMLLTRLLALRTSDKDIAPLVRPYIEALVARDPQDQMPREVLLAFHTRHRHPADTIWYQCVEVLGVGETVRLLAGLSLIGLPSDAQVLLENEARVSHRSCVVWDFVMVASPLAWRHPSARRPDPRQRYWHALQDWPYDGSGHNSSTLVADGIVTDREAVILEWFGKELRTYLAKYDSTPPQAALVADADIEALGNEALKRFFGDDIQQLLRAVYTCSPDD